MNRWKLSIIVALGFTVLVGYSDITAQETTKDKVIEQVVEGTRKDEEVNIADDIEFKTMDEEEKQALYKELDEIEMHEAGTTAVSSYSNIEELKSDDDYQAFISSTENEAKIIYLGFDECPYCRAFSPKLNQFAKENNVMVSYYNVRERADDANFQKNIDIFDIETVPHAFVMHKGKIVATINHKSTMLAIEAFVNKAVELNK